MQVDVLFLVKVLRLVLKRFHVNASPGLLSEKYECFTQFNSLVLSKPLPKPFVFLDLFWLACAQVLQSKHAGQEKQ